MGYYSTFILFWLLHLLPPTLLSLIGKGLGYLTYHFAKRRRHIGITNLTLCFPTLREKEKHQLLLKHFQSLTITLLEYGYLWFSSKKFLEKWIKVEGYEHFLNASQDNAIILFAPHFIGLDMGGLRHSIAHSHFSAIYSRPRKTSGFSRLLLRGRMRFTQAQLFARQDGIRPIIRVLRNKIPLYYLPDQDFGLKDSLFIPFFGINTATTDALSRLARAGNAKIIPMVTRREKNGYVLRYYPAWEEFPSEDIYADTRRMNAFIEERIVEMPEQYFWLHRRFKTRPPGEKGVY